MKIICKKHAGIFTIQRGHYRYATADFDMFAEMLERVIRRDKS